MDAVHRLKVGGLSN